MNQNETPKDRNDNSKFDSASGSGSRCYFQIDARDQKRLGFSQISLEAESCPPHVHGGSIYDPFHDVAGKICDYLRRARRMTEYLLEGLVPT